ncbi:hypothetical protein [Maricaulis sp.]|jgi:hypothetical protein|uniref:hypothetical protein n=1 Tax=Maricaulis sp. TaxID=1486257 RepID=UPI0025DF5AAD|nr:hypothetical protein [Maricaulis sp.]MDF1767444.1 hypothetical protein [Maricaulis sp.]
MSQPDPLADFFAADAAPAVDRGFRMAVMEQVARRRLRVELALRSLATLLLFVGVALISPVLQRFAQLLGQDLSQVLLVMLAAGLVAYLGHFWLTRKPVLRLPHLRFF